MRAGRALALLGAVGVGVAGVVAARRAAGRTERETAELVGELLHEADEAAGRRSGGPDASGATGTTGGTGPGESSAVRDVADDLAGLPDPIRRYLTHVLPDERPTVRTVRLEQRGDFRLGDVDAPWLPFAATEHVAVEPPGFVWDATIDVAPFVPVRVVDAFVAGEGVLRARLLGAIPVADAAPGPELNAGELLRYLAEAVWYPTALVPGPGLDWEPIDDRSARATLSYRGTTVSCVFHVDEADEVTRVAAERPRSTDDGYEPTPWTGNWRRYRERNGLLVPTEGEVAWNLPDGDLPYWRGQLTSIEHRTAGDRPLAPA